MLPSDQNSAGREDEPPAYGLEEVIINISISEWSPDVSSYRFSKPCHYQDLALLRSGGQEESRLETQLVSLVSQSPNLKLARVLYHALPSLQWYAFDAVSRVRMTLSPGSDWDADGSICCEEEDDTDSENDLFNSDSSSASTSPSPSQ